MNSRRSASIAKTANGSFSRGSVAFHSIAAVISLIGLADAIYLSVQALTGETLVCGGSPDCFRVLGSSYARVGGIPIALFGALAYFTVFSFAIFAAFGYNRARTLFSLTVGLMFAVTLWLLGVQAFILHAFCRFCLLSAAIIFLLAGLVVARPRPS
ncbi:MAG TPA: vitamin K epoxide reductase family protein [Chthoniobacterales bacterium]